MTSSITAPIIGVWYQPIASFLKWKGRGINTLVGFENEGGNVSLDQYCDAAIAAGLAVILQWSTVTSARALNDANVIAVVNTPDEPDGAGNVSPDQMIAQYRAIKAVTTKPVFMNVDGWKMQWRPAADYQAYVQAADWISVDYYPLNRGDAPANIPVIAQRIKQLQSLVDPARLAVRFFAFIETSDQNLKVQGWGDPTQMRGPTASEVSAEIDAVVGAGANPCYFPDVIGHNFESFDGTPDDVAGIITAKNLVLLGVPTVPAVPAIAPVPVTPPAPVVMAIPATPTPPSVPPAVTSTPVDLIGSILVVNGRAYYLRQN